MEQRARSRAENEAWDAKYAKPEGKDQYNFTDPESRIMKGPDGFVQAYNAQAAVEPDFQFIVAQAVTQAANDKEQLVPMVAAIEEQSGNGPKNLANSGDCSEKNLQAPESAVYPERRIEAFIATVRQKHDEYKEPCPRGPLPKNATRFDRMRRKLKRRRAKQCTRRAKRLLSPSSDRSNRRADFVSFYCGASPKCAVSGHWCA